MAYRYKAYQLMWRKDYPKDHSPSRDAFSKLRRYFRKMQQEIVWEEYLNFNGVLRCYHPECPEICRDNQIEGDYEFHSPVAGGEFESRGQFLNWITEKRLKDGTKI